MASIQSATGTGNKLLHHPYGWDQRSQHCWQRSRKGKTWQPVKTSVSPFWERCVFHSQPNISHFGLLKSKITQIQIVTLKSQLAGKQSRVSCQDTMCNTISETTTVSNTFFKKQWQKSLPRERQQRSICHSCYFHLNIWVCIKTSKKSREKSFWFEWDFKETTTGVDRY